MRVKIAITSFAFGVMVALLLTAHSAAAQAGCPTATPSPTPGGTLTFDGTGSTSTDTFSFNKGLYRTEVTDDVNKDFVSIELLTVTQGDCIDQFVFQKEITSGIAANQVKRYDVFGKSTSCDVIMNVSAQGHWTVKFTPLK